MCALSFFFFQAEDGIRDYKVTGVQTCALPICAHDHGQRPPGRRPPERAAPLMLEWGRELSGAPAPAERREWLCTNGTGGFASATVAGTLPRRSHGLLVAAQEPPLGRTLLVAKVEERAAYIGHATAFGTNRWAGGAVDPHGYREIEHFRLDGTTPVWTYAVADALVEKRVWMEPGANTPYVRYRVRRARGPVSLELKVLVNYRDYHGTTRGDGWLMDVAPVRHGLRVTAFDGARPLLLLAEGAEGRIAHTWHDNFDLARERERGLDAVDAHLHAGTFRAPLEPGGVLTLVLSAEAAPSPDGADAWRRHERHEEQVVGAWKRARPEARRAPAGVRPQGLAGGQFLVQPPPPHGPHGLSGI